MKRLGAVFYGAMGALFLLYASASAHAGAGSVGGHGVSGHGFAGGHAAAGGHGGWGGRANWGWGGWRGGTRVCCGWSPGGGVAEYNPLWDPYLWDYAPSDSGPIADAPPHEATWYYCRDSGSYYPYVQRCATPWQAVPVKP